MKKGHLIYAVIVLILGGGLGTFLLLGYGQDQPPRLWWLQQHLLTVGQQLAEIKSHLQVYKKAHGSYPTNDEGLAALDDFRARAYVVFDADGIHRYSLGSRGYANLERSIAAWSHKAGHLPGNAEELEEASGAFAIAPENARIFEGSDRTMRGEIVIGDGGDFFFMSPAGLLTFLGDALHLREPPGNRSGQVRGFAGRGRLARPLVCSGG